MGTRVRPSLLLVPFYQSLLDTGRTHTVPAVAVSDYGTSSGVGFSCAALSEVLHCVVGCCVPLFCGVGTGCVTLPCYDDKVEAPLVDSRI